MIVSLAYTCMMTHMVVSLDDDAHDCEFSLYMYDDAYDCEFCLYIDDDAHDCEFSCTS
jgi:hypothetical protein